jgi:hypothetical protein
MDKTTTMTPTPALAAAVTLSALVPAVALAHVVAGELQDCSLRAVLPGAYGASLVPALLTAAYFAHHRAQTPVGRAVAGIAAVVGTLAVLVCGGLAIALLGVIGGAAIYPGAVMLVVFAVVGLPVFWLALRYLAGMAPGLVAVIAVVPLVVFVLGDASRACHLAV